MRILEAPGSNGFDVEHAHAEIAEILQEVSQMGANDSEYGSLGEILDRLERKEIPPDEAVHLARMIADGKEDYH
jgi:hypothetical protein